jgi:hypothetical protein
MKIAVTFFLIFRIMLLANAQKDTSNIVADIAIAPIAGLHFNTINNQIDNLNSSLLQRGFPTISPIFNSIGIALIHKSGKIYNSTEIAYLYATHDIADGINTSQYRLVPKITGINIRGISTRKLWESGKKRIEAGLGISISKFNFKLVDRIAVQNSFDTLLKSPILASGSLEYTQKGFNWNVEGRFGFTYNTKWFAKLVEAYEFSIFINYSQAIINSKDWTVSDTKIKIPNFPLINFSNIYFQFANSIYFRRK